MENAETIAAIATPPGSGGVSMVRVSGPDAFSFLQKVFKSASDNFQIKSYRLFHGTIVDPVDGNVLDEVLVGIFRKPNSYTGDDVVEINCHGGVVITRSILELCLRNGVRLARPGEFTQRAFINGRMDLAQAEAVADLISARSLLAAKVAVHQLCGELGLVIGGLRDRMVDLLAELEAHLEFPEEDLDDLPFERLGKESENLRTDLAALAETGAEGRLLREGARIGLLGRTNVGKSSLMNRLLTEDRALVSPEAGTTRDYIEEGIVLSGIPITLVDTAGFRFTTGTVEKMGIEKSRGMIGRLQGALCLFDGSLPPSNEDSELLEETAAIPRIAVINKNDLEPDPGWDEFCETNGIKPISISVEWADGIDTLKTAVIELITGGAVINPDETIISNLRHIEALNASADSLAQAADILVRGTDPELAAIDLRSALDNLSSITGQTYTDDILSSIFSRFCIGK
jgi:tRNA modification GTPase